MGAHVAARVPGWGEALDRLRHHAEASAALVEAAGLPPFAVDLVRYQSEPRDPEFGRRVPARRRGRLMTLAGMPSVAFGEGRRPEAATHVTLPAFDGPLALLLSLIEARQLDVLTVPLGALADAYLDALATLDDDRMGHVSAFVAIASQLILIKSRAMLPRREVEGPVALADEGPDPEAELRARLILYRAFRDAGTSLLDAATARGALFHRESVTARARRARRRPGTRRRAAVAGDPRPRARRPRADRPAAPAAARDDPADGHAHVAGGDHPRGAARGAGGRAPGPAPGRARPGRGRGHVPRPARAHEAARDRRRAGRAVGPDRGPPHDARGARGRGVTAVVDEEAPLDESLESFA